MGDRIRVFLHSCICDLKSLRSLGASKKMSKNGLAICKLRHDFFKSSRQLLESLIEKK